MEQAVDVSAKRTSKRRLDLGTIEFRLTKLVPVE